MASMLLSQVANGVGIGIIYFMIAVGMSITFGMMRFLNIAHGGFYLLGAYVGFELVQQTGSFWFALVGAPICIGLVAWLSEPAFSVLYRLSHNMQILATLGLALVIQETVVLVWDTVGKHVAAPGGLVGAVAFGDFVYPRYRLFVICVGVVLAAGLWLLLERTNYGAVLRAGTQSTDDVELLGIDIRRVFAATFGLGAGLAGLAGVLAAPIRGVEPFMGPEALAIAFVVVVVGGLGSFFGALAGGLLIGIIQSTTSVFWPAASGVAMYVGMAAIMLIRPRGLLGRA